jgi:hypothetical protein
LADTKAAAYKELFLRLGRARLSGLIESEDTGLALQAAWHAAEAVAQHPEDRIS